MTDPTHELRTQDENTPLLSSGDTPPASILGPKKPGKLRVLVITSILVLAVDFGLYLTIVPQTDIFENIICRNYLANTNQPTPAVPPVNLCKSEPVQSELALVNGWKETFDVLPGIVLSVPYGILADKWGRKPVITLGMLGIILGECWVRVICLYSNILPLRLVWVSGVWRIVGGGDLTLTSIALAMVADLFSGDEMATALFRLNSVAILAEILATPVSASLMRYNAWLPFMLGLGISILGSFAVVFLPESLADAQANTCSSAILGEEEEGSELVSAKRDMPKYLKSKVRAVRDSSRFLFNTPGMYSSMKFDWSLASSSFLVSLRGAVTMASFLFLMPGLSSWITHYLHLHGKWKDLWLSQGTSLISGIGFFIVAITTSPVILVIGMIFLSFGAGFPVTCRSFVTSLVPPDHVGRLYSAITAVMSVGVVASGPFLAYAFSLGLRLGSLWIGLPFLLASVAYFLGYIALSRLQIPWGAHPAEEQEPLVP
ncbi:hypothetical protein ARAM_003759 [Aspergillus rambellii]|uniref:Major facilitator superfamily (MFS) profile domain-containing protein n=1 Tax=Aspergillus rambellii TaxID=308745 RepID=A0A0F8WGL6_9EURO|nr:hypothetical protein ARAM_003759 [Aspergillus rambellii]